MNTLLRTPEIEGDENFVDVIWENVEDTAAVSGEENFSLVDIDMQRYDFHLSQDSPAIDNGAADYSLPDDRDGKTRDASPDMVAMNLSRKNNYLKL